MESCWTVLGINYTTDISEIKKAYRELIKIYHPDKAHTPERKREYTIKAAKIIEAYEKALLEVEENNYRHEIDVIDFEEINPYESESEEGPNIYVTFTITIIFIILFIIGVYMGYILYLFFI